MVVSSGLTWAIADPAERHGIDHGVKPVQQQPRKPVAVGQQHRPDEQHELKGIADPWSGPVYERADHRLHQRIVAFHESAVHREIGDSGAKNGYDGDKHFCAMAQRRVNCQCRGDPVSAGE